MSVARTQAGGSPATASRSESALEYYGLMLAGLIMAVGQLVADRLPDSYQQDVLDAVELLKPTDDTGQVSGFMVMIIGGSALIVGFFVVATINAALPSIENSNLASDKNTTLDRIGQALVLGGVVLIVIGVTMVLRTLRSV